MTTSEPAGTCCCAETVYELAEQANNLLMATNFHIDALVRLANELRESSHVERELVEVLDDEIASFSTVAGDLLTMGELLAGWS